MKGMGSRLPLLVAVIVATLALPAPAAGATIVRSATGSGHFEFTSDAGVTALNVQVHS